MKNENELIDDIPLLQDSEPIFEEWAAESTSDMKHLMGHVEDMGGVDDDDLGIEEEKLQVPAYRRKKGNPRPATIATCDVCGVDLKHPSRIKEHMRTHTGEKPYECDQCGKKFSQPSPLINHYRAQHLNDFRFVCDYFGCGKRFVNASRKNAHELTHSGMKRNGPPRPHLKPAKKMICPQLDDELNSRLSLSSRANFTAATIISPDYPSTTNIQSSGSIRKPPVFPPESEQSEKTRESNARIDDVISSVLARVLAPHSEETTANEPEKPPKKREYVSNRVATYGQCNVCGIFLKHPSKIREHIRTHTGEKPFQCGECGLMLTKASSLRVHIRRMHTKERPYQCTWGCNASFVTESVRKEHEMAVHAGLKRYTCIVKDCSAVFARRAYLMRHRKNAHPEIFTPIFDHIQVAAEEAADPVIDEKDMYYADTSVMMLSIDDVRMLAEFDEEEFVERGEMQDIDKDE
uniref:Zinc finger, C2H2 type n=1 Tax=Caenorhabditis tropicalis TaxID=1561998 RepID=A0A1I7UM26_9PELO